MANRQIILIFPLFKTVPELYIWSCLPEYTGENYICVFMF